MEREPEASLENGKKFKSKCLTSSLRLTARLLTAWISKAVVIVDKDHRYCKSLFEKSGLASIVGGTSDDYFIALESDEGEYALMQARDGETPLKEVGISPAPTDEESELRSGGMWLHAASWK